MPLDVSPQAVIARSERSERRGNLYRVTATSESKRSAYAVRLLRRCYAPPRNDRMGMTEQAASAVIAVVVIVIVVLHLVVAVVVHLVTVHFIMIHVVMVHVSVVHSLVHPAVVHAVHRV